jgi:hypothetical protein
MERLNPVSPVEAAEREETERFLEGSGETSAPSKEQPKHEH